MDRDLTAFLVQLSIALHKSAAYPSRHPLAVAAVADALDALTERLRDNAPLALGIARSQILIDGESTDAGHPVLRELAQRLYRRQIGGIEFAFGVEAGELTEFLVYVNGRPEGAAHTESPQWPHIRVVPLAFDRLRLAGDSAPVESERRDRAQRLWGDLARAAFADTWDAAASQTEDPLDARALAAVINAQMRDDDYTRSVSRQLIELGEAARQDEGPEARAVRRQLAELFSNLSPDTLNHLLRLGPDAGQRRLLAVDMARTMPVGAVVELVRAFAGANEQTISHSLLRIFSKLATHADTTAPGEATEDDEALRDMVRELLHDWVLRDPNPAAYSAVLEGLARPAGPGGATTTQVATGARLATEVGPAEARRVVQIAVEAAVYGAPVARAVETMIEGGGLAELVELLAAAPGDDATAEMIWQRVATPDMLRDLLTVDEPEPQVVEPLVQRLGIDAAEPLLDALVASPHRATRRRLLQWLGAFGSRIGSAVMARLDSPHWYVQRNMLLLLGAMAARPSDFIPRTYLGHPDARVRREALKIALRTSELRDEAISRGLGEADEQNLRMAIASALDGCPPQALPFVERQLQERNHSPELRTLLIRAVGAIAAPAACDWLVARCLTKRRFLRGVRLTPKSSDLVAAVTALALRWAQNPKAAEVLRLAVKSRDAELQAAAAPPVPSAPPPGGSA
ncbi:MAG TPA: hypothetical protein VHJ69_03030 [Gemmatimonadales bacterium]|nr:hypothetical protein [Gemmatimonadales bacterium]